MLDSNISPGKMLQTLVLGERKICFCSPEMHHNSSIMQCRILKFSGVNIPDLRFRGGGGRKICFHFPKMYQNSHSNAEFKNFLRDNTPDPRFRGEENLFQFSKMYHNSPKNSKSFPGTIHQTPVLWERKVGFISLIMYQNAPTAMQNSKNFQNSRTPVFAKERGKLPPLEIMSSYATESTTQGMKASRL